MTILPGLGPNLHMAMKAGCSEYVYVDPWTRMAGSSY